MSNTEKLIKQLNENKELRKQKETVLTPAVRIQQIKNNLIFLAHDLLVSKKIDDSLYRKIQLLTYSKTTEKTQISWEYVGGEDVTNCSWDEIYDSSVNTIHTPLIIAVCSAHLDIMANRQIITRG